MIQQHTHMRKSKDGNIYFLLFASISRQGKHLCLLPGMCRQPAEVTAAVTCECTEAVRFESLSALKVLHLLVTLSSLGHSVHHRGMQ